MADARTCPDCGSELPPRAPEGLCPRCLLGAGLNSDALSVGRGGDVGATMSLGSGGVLETITATLGAVPRVLLRDTDAGLESPLVRPGREPGDDSTRYRIDGEIARGGMGAVLKGRDPDLGRDVAIKVLRDDLRDNPDMVRRFVEEAQIGGQLQHPGIVPIYELGAFADRRPFFSMKLVKGHTLAALLDTRRDPASDLPRLLNIVEAIAQTVAYAHARGVIHRDLKPSNVMVGSFGEVQVMDWGLAKVLPRGGVVDDASAGKPDRDETVIATARSGSGDTDLSHAGSVLGTPSYMAPEQARGEIGRVDERADVFALGSILCEVLTGQPAFTGRSSGEIQRKAALGDTADAQARLNACGADTELVALARGCLAGEAEDRPRDASAVSSRLTAYLSGVQERLRSAERERAVAEARAVEERRRRKLQAGLAAAVLALVGLAGAGGLILVRQRADRLAATTRVVDDALAWAAELRGRAKAAPVGVLIDWDSALAQVKRAEDALAQGAADDALRARVAAARGELDRLRAEAEHRAKDAEAERKLVARLMEIRIAEVVDRNDSGRAVRGYTAAFREFGVDIDALDPKAAGAALAGRPGTREIVGALDALLLDMDFFSPPYKRFREVARAADPDPWRNSLRMMTGRGNAEMIEDLKRLAADRDALDRQPGDAFIFLASLLRLVGENALADEVARQAWLKAPDDFWINWTLGMLSWGGGDDGHLTRPEEAARYLRVAVALRPENARAMLNLAEALYGTGDKAQGAAVLRELIRRRPGSAGGHGNLAVGLIALGKLDEAEHEAREAIRLNPASSHAHLQLGIVLSRTGREAGAEAEFGEAVRLAPRLRVPHEQLAALLERTGRRGEAEAERRDAAVLGTESIDWAIAQGPPRWPFATLGEAEAAFREAIRRHPEVASLRFGLGLVLRRQGRIDEAAGATREAARLEPDRSLYVFDLAVLDQWRGDDEAAITVSRRALELHPGAWDAHRNIGLALLSLGRPAEARAEFEAARALRPDHPELPIEFRMVDLAPRLPAVLRGEDRPRDADEGVAFATLCYRSGRFAAAARLYLEALERWPALRDDWTFRHDAQAARFAIRSAANRRRGEPAPTEPERADLLRRALDLLRSEHAAWAARLGRDPGAAPKVSEALRFWVSDYAFAPVREPDALARLPEAERKDWRALWADVGTLLKKAGGP